jgi:hypothetical protein
MGDENPETFVSPCQCRGTSAYIHAECLDMYFTYYPDRVCRVCMTQMEGSADPWLSYAMIALLGVTVTYSGVDFLVKLGLGLSMILLIVFYAKNNLFNNTVVSFLLSLYLTFAAGGHPDAVFIFLFTMYIVSLGVTILVTRQLSLFLLLAPPFFALATRMVLLLDALATGVYVSILFLVWYAWIRTAVGNRANPLLT